jgi:hypothetical protein
MLNILKHRDLRKLSKIRHTFEQTFCLFQRYTNFAKFVDLHAEIMQQMPE